ncbi:MAG TPA: radical SAM protein, partial [Myxococcota bacterium]
MNSSKERERTRLQSLDSGVVTLAPHTVHFDLTNACNTDCVTCWDHSPHLEQARPSSWKRQRADAATVASTLDDIHALGGLEAVILSGMGEPFTHPDVYAIIADVKRRGLHLTIITNLVAADVDQVMALGVDALLVGVQGASLASYLAFHPSFHESHWRKLNEQLSALAHSSVDVKHVQVICAHNAHELRAMIDLAWQMRARQINFKLASLKHGTEAVRISHDQRSSLLSHGHGSIDDACAHAASLGVATNLAVLRAQVEAGGELTAAIDSVGCFLGTSYARITVDGTALYCCNTETVVGTISPATPFSSLWTGSAWGAMRTRLREGRYFDGCYQCGKLNQNVKLAEKYRAL